MTTQKRLPLKGADVEVLGVIGTVIGAAVMTDGNVQLTVRACPSNIKLIRAKAEKIGTRCELVGSEFVLISASACVWRAQPAGTLYDEEADTMLGHTDEHLRASMEAHLFQIALSRRKSF